MRHYTVLGSVGYEALHCGRFRWIRGITTWYVKYRRPRDTDASVLVAIRVDKLRFPEICRHISEDFNKHKT
jgi:hypothetical protein